MLREAAAEVRDQFCVLQYIVLNHSVMATGIVFPSPDTLVLILMVV